MKLVEVTFGVFIQALYIVRMLLYLLLCSSLVNQLLPCIRRRQHRQSCLCLVKMTRVSWIFHVWSIRCFWHFSLSHKVPVDATEKILIHYVFCRCQSFIGIFPKKLFQQIFSFFRMKIVELWLIRFYILIHFLSISAIKRWLTSKHFIDNTAKAPPIASFSIRTIILQQLWSKVLWSSTQTLCTILSIDVFFRKTKISEKCISFVVNQYVFRF